MIEDFYNSVGIVLRKTSTSDGFGGGSIAFSTHISSYACRITQTSGVYIIAAAGLQTHTTHKLFGTVVDIQATDKIQVGTVTYIVVEVYIVQDKGSEHHLEAKLRRE